MQAVVRNRQFGFGGLKSMLLVATFAAGIAVGVAGPAALNHAPTLRASGHSVSVARVYAGSQNASLGEGRVGPQASATLAPPRAYAVLGQGDGLVGGNRDLLRASLTAYASVGMGEGWLENGRPVVALPIAHLSDGAGEGWLENGRP